MFSVVCDRKDYILVPTKTEYILIRKTDVGEVIFVAQTGVKSFTLTVISVEGIAHTYEVDMVHHKSMIHNCRGFIKGIGSILNV